MSKDQSPAAQLDLDIIGAQMEIVGLSVAAWRSQVLYTGVRIGLFESLGRSSKTAEELSNELECPRRSLDRLLMAAHAMGLLKRDDGRYGNGPAVARTLIDGRPGYVGNWVSLMSHIYKAWRNLETAVRTGEHVEAPEVHLGENEEYTRDFILSMDDYAHYRGSDLLNYLDFSGCKSLIDVGAGPGTYSIMFAQAFPELTCTVYDLPNVVEIAKEYVTKAGLSDRVLLKGGSYYDDELGHDEYDIAFLSDMLHQEDAKTGMMILEKAFRALHRGGRVVVQAMFVNDDHSGPEWAALHNLAMLVFYRGGKNYTMAETIPWLEKAGFVDIQRIQTAFYNVNSLIVARKP